MAWALIDISSAKAWAIDDNLSLSSDSEESLVARIHRGVDSVNHARRFATSSVRLGDRYIQFSAAIDVTGDHLRTSCVQWTERLSPRFPKA